jgi:hypothetical protein
VPGSEDELLSLAATAGLAELKDEGRRRRLHAKDPDELHRRQRQARGWHHWVDEHGLVHGTGTWTPETGVPLVNRIDAETDRLARKDRGDGDTSTREQLAADAVAKLILNGDGKPAAPRAELVLVCDIAAFQRGHTQGDEICHIIGGGPVPVAVAVELATAAFIKAVLHDGTRIDTISHLRRYQPAELRTALNLGKPPLFQGAACVDCGRRYGIQWDHVDPVAHHGPTSYENIKPRCWPCHQEKTRRDRQAGLLTPQAPNPCSPKPTSTHACPESPSGDTSDTPSPQTIADPLNPHQTNNPERPEPPSANPADRPEAPSPTTSPSARRPPPPSDTPPPGAPPSPGHPPSTLNIDN